MAESVLLVFGSLKCFRNYNDEERGEQLRVLHAREGTLKTSNMERIGTSRGHNWILYDHLIHDGQGNVFQRWCGWLLNTYVEI